MQVKFKEWDCEVYQSKYANGRTAIQLVDAEDGMPIATATVNLPNEPLADGEVFVKDYSENEGLLQVLQDAGVVVPTGRVVVSGFVSVPVCKVVGG